MTELAIQLVECDASMSQAGDALVRFVSFSKIKAVCARRGEV